MKTRNKSRKYFAAPSFLLLAFLATSQIASAATYYLHFATTTVSTGAGPVNPTNGPVAIYGSQLFAGDQVVVDGVAISQNPGTGDQWAGFNLNGAGLQGVTSATLGVKTETANGTGNSALFPGAGTSFGDVGATTNHVRIVLTAATTGSTTNMTYLAETDPNFTGTTYYPLTGTVTFPNNIIPLSFGAHAQPQAFYDTSGALAISSIPASSDPLLDGNTWTFTAAIQGPPAGNYSFQWLSNNVPIAGATSQAYTTPPIAAANNGDLYSVILLTNSVNCVTSSPSVLNYHAGPATWTFNFPTTSWVNGGSTNTPVITQFTDITKFAAGDKVVFDGIIIGTGPWGGPVINGPASTSSQQLTAAGLGVLLRFGGNGNVGAVYANAANVNNALTTAAAQTNHLRIELYISTQGSLANMGWKVLLDQNLTGTFSITSSGTNLTFLASSLWLAFDSQNCSSISFAQYIPKSTFGYSGGPFTYNGSGQSPNITFSGSTGAKTTNYLGVSVTYSSANAPTNAGNYYLQNTVAAGGNYPGTNSSQAMTISPRVITVTAQTNVKLFDNTTSATNSPTLTSGTMAAGDTAFYTEAYQNASIGTGKTLIPVVTITNTGNVNVTADYAVTPVNDTTGVINAVVPTVSSANLTAGTFQMTFTGPNGQPYEVLTSTNVATPLVGWVTNSSGILTGGNVTYTNQSPTNPSQFYIIQSP